MPEGEMRRKGRLNAVLFVLTVLSTFAVGLLWAQGFLSADEVSRAAASGGLAKVAGPFTFAAFLDLRVIGLAALYSVVLMTILAGHELAHYLTCRRYGIEATLPYF